jgi:LuxR family transcriptional regulator, maltose regulon positive regulatory protein
MKSGRAADGIGSPEEQTFVMAMIASSSRPRTRPESAQLLEFPLAAALDVDEVFLRAPVVRPGSVTRRALVNRLRAADSQPVATVIAPAGYGKTTLLAQWSERDSRPFAWVTVSADDDARSLVAAVTAALGLRGRSGSLTPRRVAKAFFAVEQPIVLVLEEVEHLRSRECLDAVADLMAHVPPGSTLVLAGRTRPDLPIARLRAGGRLFELGADDLALSRRESLLLLQGAGIEVDREAEAEIVERSEGWAAGLHLAALSVRDSGARDESSRFTGADRFVVEYLQSELMVHLRPAEIRFLTRTSVLGTLSGPSCDAVLESKGSARRLSALEKSGLAVPLDRTRETYRYRRLFRDMLRAELDQREPDLVPALNRRAARWYEARGRFEDAVEHAIAAGDADRVARLLGVVALPIFQRGGAATVERWLAWFDDDRKLARHPAVAVLGAWVHAARGRAETADRWFKEAQDASPKGPMPDGSRGMRPWLALLRAAFCRNGVERMVADAELALRELAPGSYWRPTALLLCGAAHRLVGDPDLADANLAAAVDAAAETEAFDAQAQALAERSLLAGACGDYPSARSLAQEAGSIVDEGRLWLYPTTAVQLVAAARAELRGGTWEQARAHLDEADRLRPELTHALPRRAVQARLELARAHMTLLEVAEARSLLDEAGEIIRLRPALEVLVAEVDEIRAECTKALNAQRGRASTLTPAELRLMPLLSSHLSFREIGDQLFVSRNTVKTQAISIYRKLGVSSRSDAIARAADLGLVDARAAAPQDFIPTG